MQLHEDQRSEFLEFCRWNVGYEAIRRRLEELGHPVSIASVSSWHRKAFPPGMEAIALREVTADFSGIDAQSLHEFSLGLAAKLLAMVGEEINGKRRLAEFEHGTIYNAIALLKELRQSASVFEDRKFLKDRRAHELNGAYRLAQLITTWAKETPYESAIENMLAGCLQTVEREVNDGS